jgi:hypothetical protein
VLPAHQGLKADDSAAGNVALRLVVHGQLVGVQGDAKFFDSAEAFAAVLVVGRVVAMHPTAGGFGGVQRHVGALQQTIAVIGVLRAYRDAYAGADAKRDAVEVERLGELLEQPVRDLFRVLTGGGVQYDGELVAAQAHHQVRRTQCWGYPGAYLAQQLVSDVVSKGVVDLLEVVQIDKQYRQLLGWVCGQARL